MAFVSLFRRSQMAIIGMIHLHALPGSPSFSSDMDEIISTACTEAEIFKQSGFDAIMVENMYDVPWLLGHQQGPETTAAMAVVCSAVRHMCPSLPIGVQILSAANQQALAVAKAADLNFIRVEGFVFSHIGDEGPIHACAPELLRYRKHIGADHIQIFTDIKKKHSSHAITNDITLVETAEAAELFKSDGVIITGSSTGVATNPTQVIDVQKSINIPVLVGSGVTTSNLHQYTSASGIIIGSHLKVNGKWNSELDPTKAEMFMELASVLRQSSMKGEKSPPVAMNEVVDPKKYERFRAIDSEGA